MTFIIDFGAILAYIILSLGIVIQSIRVIKRKSAQDISILETILRTLASIVILIKMISIQDKYLIIGQSIFLVIYFLYIIIIAKYRYLHAVKQI